VGGGKVGKKGETVLGLKKIAAKQREPNKTEEGRLRAGYRLTFSGKK